jgi:hypothetical protein
MTIDQFAVVSSRVRKPCCSHSAGDFGFFRTACTPDHGIDESLERLLGVLDRQDQRSQQQVLRFDL